MSRNHSKLIALTAACLLLFGTADELSAKRSKHPPTACGLKYFPLFEGASWTYEPVNQPPGVPPAKVTITVSAVKSSKGSAEITLTETYRGITTTMQATCNKDALKLPIDSFFYAAEPGSGITSVLSNVERNGTPSLPGRAGLIAGEQRFEKITADVSRPPSEGTKAEHDPARFELEMLTEVHPQETVESGIGPYRATHVSFEMRGRATVAPGTPGEKQQEISVRTPGALWFDSTVGVVRAREVSGREWQLIETNVLN